MLDLHLEKLLLAGVELGLEAVGVVTGRADRRNVQQS